MRQFNMYERVYTRDEMGQANVLWFCIGGAFGTVGTVASAFLAMWVAGWL
jgi:hypothetical protein